MQSAELRKDAPVELFACAKLLLGLVTFGDVNARPRHVRGQSPRIAERLAAIEEPAKASVRIDNTKLHLEVGTARCTGLAALDHPARSSGWTMAMN